MMRGVIETTTPVGVILPGAAKIACAGERFPRKLIFRTLLRVGDTAARDLAPPPHT